ncbi:Gfo/Idh/MocA family protein [Haladaptatus sp. DFWS20]|uniref:Gfo/Idh/MocA family protein n=1 Tax=Haladaptatus sp. DFWS20 TaxID=3403467 RepID=UPI003EB7C2DC
MIDVGLVGLDTSHAEAFASTLSDFGDMELNGIWDGGSVREQAYVEDFCDTYNTCRYEDLDQMVDRVDAAMVLTVNWETHRPIAIRFLEEGVPTLVDKPLAGNRKDVDAIAEATEHAPLFGGSAVPFHPDFDDIPRGEDDRTMFAAGYNDFFYYRVHLTDTLRLLADADWADVTPTAKPGTTVDIRFTNETHATLRFDGNSVGGSFSILDVGDRTRTIEIPAKKEALREMYGPYLETFRNVVYGERDTTDRILDSAGLLLAIETALAKGQTVRPNDDAIDDLHVDGVAFLDQYDPYY